MASDKKAPKKSVSEPVKDLEGLSDEELDGVSGGSTMTVTCCRGGGGGGCGGTNTGTSHEANVVGEKGDVELNPTKKG